MGTTLTASYKSNYPKISKNGNPITVFVYRVTGNEQELAEFRAAQGDNFVTDDDGTPLYFTVNTAPVDVCKMYKVQGGNNAGQYRLDLADFRKDMAIVAAAGGNLASVEAYVGKAIVVYIPAYRDMVSNEHRERALQDNNCAFQTGIKMTFVRP